MYKMMILACTLFLTRIQLSEISFVMLMIMVFGLYWLFTYTYMRLWTIKNTKIQAKEKII